MEISSSLALDFVLTVPFDRYSSCRENDLSVAMAGLIGIVCH